MIGADLPTMNTAFTRRIASRIEGGRAPAVVGLDPRADALPARVAPGESPDIRIVAFYRDAMPVIAEHAAAVKPNIAFFEALGSAGVRAYEETCDLARDAGLPIIGDVKRGDVGSTAEAYAEAGFRCADALTLHPWLGRDSVEPFLAWCRDRGRGVFVLVRTSNPSAAEFQGLRVGDRTMSETVAAAVDAWGAELVDELGYSAVGAVVGATWPAELRALRALMPHAWLLIPGVGAQGGSVADLAPAFDGRGLGALVAQSRGVMQCFDPADAGWLDRIESALVRFCQELREVAASP